MHQFSNGHIEPWSTTDMRGFADPPHLNSVDSQHMGNPAELRANTISPKFLDALSDNTPDSELKIT